MEPLTDIKELLEDLESADLVRRFRRLARPDNGAGAESPPEAEGEPLDDLLLQAILSLSQMIDLFSTIRSRAARAREPDLHSGEPIPLVDLAAQHRALSPAIDEALTRVLDRSDFILGRDVGQFEREFAAYCGVRYGIGVDSGTSALELCLRALGVGPGDEVIVPTNSFIATAFAVTAAGATPVMVDVDPATATLSPAAFDRAVTRRTKAVVPVHLYGHPADMNAVRQIASTRGLLVVEDACQAHGASYRGWRVGSLSDAAAFSFYPSKNLGALGDGGIVVTDRHDVAVAVRKLRNYGQQEKHDHEVCAGNHRLDTLQAAILRLKLPRLDRSNEARRQIARRYGEALSDPGVVLPVETEGCRHVYHLYVVRSSRRDAIARALAERSISTGVHYPVPIHLQKAFRDLGYGKGDCPVAEGLAGTILSLPIYPEMSNAAVDTVAEAVNQAAREAGA